MTGNPLRIETSGGVLVGFVVLAVVVFELRTVLGMLFGIDVSGVVYFPVALAVLVGLLVAENALRSVGSKEG
ncbi:hypothetical protein GCM10008995_24780 [Halobellus salinus]|uniref:CbaC protein n=1 Tax=Halobellus salinus TaxID=931585 RepID=A0A830EKD2_9EURY|nr:hypothetical protein [Halobellus salinus]GGJ13968.1 hypothetical protein GCM10008995_24780 [Halobellus salinus]SMP31740.1 hypothetical protein SAMN06265347_1197 [Halobellus salinus]